MTFSKPAFKVSRDDPSAHLGHFVKSFNPPKASPKTPELMNPTNPVPEFMESLGLYQVSTPHTIQPDLMHGQDLLMWDGKKLRFFLFGDKDLKSPFNKGFFPGPIIRVPRGVIFHGSTKGHGPPPHTIHWHGIEPTPMNDGNGHCSMEIGDYTYQWQPNFIGTYFYHCHRNTVQHFEYGLYSGLFIEPCDAFESGPGKNPGGYPRRTAANLTAFPEFPDFIGGSLESGDPHAMTVRYDREAFWAVDDIDSVWMTEMRDPRAAFPKRGLKPGINDRFMKADFHDFNPDYFCVTGNFFPGRRGSSAGIVPAITVPAALNSGVSGLQVSILAKRGETILVRVLCAAYSKVHIKFPMDVVIIAFDGRGLGIPPYGKYNKPFRLEAGDTVALTTARRCDFLIRSEVAVDSFAEVTYFSHSSHKKLFTGRIPLRIL